MKRRVTLFLMSRLECSLLAETLVPGFTNMKGIRMTKGDSSPNAGAVARTSTSRIHWSSRIVICTAVVGSLGTLLMVPANLLFYVLDVLLRTYLIFVGTVMAHEGTHGQLGRTRRANFWWGRLALLPSTVPFTNFQRTHRIHHAHTNIPGEDPDLFIKSNRAFEIPLRALAMPHQWFFWLLKRGKVTRRHLLDLTLNYLGIAVIFGLLLYFVGWQRLLWGMVPSLFLVSLLLWYCFAFKTHEGFSTDPPETRSHDYYGKFMYFFSFGLSLHRSHHLHPNLSWMELKSHVQPAPKGTGWSLLPARDVHRISSR